MHGEESTCSVLDPIDVGKNDFKPCFEALVISNIPILLLCVAGIPRIVTLLRRPAPSVPFGVVYFLKMFLVCLVAAVFAAMLVFKIRGTNDNDTASWIPIFSYSMTCASIILGAVIHHFEHMRSRISSTVMLLFWSLMEIVSAIRLRSLIIRGGNVTDPIGFWLFVSQMTIVLLVFILEMIPKPRDYYISLDEDVSNACPEENANIFSRISFLWMDPLMKLGYSKNLEMEDLWNLKRTDSAAFNSEMFQRAWSDELSKKKPSFVGAICRTYGLVFASAAIFKISQDMLSFTQPQLLSRLMVFASSWSENVPADKHMDWSIGLIIALTMLFTAMIQTVFLHQYFHVCLVTGMRVKTAIASAVYVKSLRLSNTSRQSSTTGEIVNLMSVDAGRIADLCSYLHIVWSGPFQISLALYYLHDCLGASIFAGVAVMILTIPLNGYLAAKSKNFNRTQMKNKDARAKLIDEVLSTIKVIKLYAWEIPFKRRVNEIRENELTMLKKIGYLSAAQSFTWACTPFLVSLTTFALYAFISNEPLTSKKVFVAISLFDLLQFPLTVFPNVISSLVEASVSCSRLYKFLILEELDRDAVNFEPITPTGFASKISRLEILNGTFSWNKKVVSENGIVVGGITTLRNIILSVHDGCLLAVVGGVGSGKSSLISAVLGEMYKEGGEVVLRGSIAYVPQTAWIMNATLRDNILFGRRFEPKFYEEVINACGLKLDLEMLSAGDLTEIGERGINLSGGQKQRVSLARAVYSRAEIFLFDDPLSAVDAHVGNHIFAQVIGPKGLLKDKARLFVTHGIHVLPETSKIIMMKDGEVCETGTYESLMKFESNTMKLMKEYGKRKDNTTDDSENVPTTTATTAATTASSISEKGSRSGSTTKINTVASGKIEAAAVGGGGGAAATAAGKALVAKEETAKGSVSWNVYKAYGEACSWSSVIMYIIIAMLSQVIAIGQNLFLADWAKTNDGNSTVGGGDKEYVWRLSVYGGLGILFSISVILCTIYIWIFCGVRSARLLHSQMLENVMKLPQSFFDVTPLGRVFNRFSKDQYTVDEVLPRAFHGYFRTLFSVISVLAVNVISSPMFLLFAVPLGFLYAYYQKYYLATSRELKRLDSTSKSPVYAHFQETLGGVSTIRAYKQEDRFCGTNEDRLDFNQRAYYPSISSNRWLAVRLEFIGSLVVFGSALFAVVSIFVSGYINASLIGLSVAYSLRVTQTLNWMVRMSCEIESQIISVERIKEYIELPQEAPHHIEGRRPRREWPDRGAIEFKNYSTRYRQGLELVLNGVSCVIKPREKIGIVGRTGAGKSSLTVALFRLIEPAIDGGDGGTIIIDGIDIRTLGLHDLRSKLTIIPQDPVLFTGSVRDNLDPLGLYDEASLWKALESSSLKPYVSGLEKKLDYEVLQGGENFSVGQRQLLCLARALLRRTNILLLDEATAAIDVETDAIIQRTIRREFAGCTILTIAHRINTVMDSDRILVLDQGRISEFDTPEVLLKKKTSKFFSLAKEAGLI